jgi:PilZ domain
MHYGEDFPKDMRMRPKRRGPRMNSRVPVGIEWSGHAGPLHSEPGFTRVVSANGCLLVSPKELELQQRLRLTNLSTRRSVEAIVVWKGMQGTDGWDMGIEILARGQDFWGVEL